MKINRYITRGISEHLSLDLQILLWNMVKERDNQPHTDYLHIFRLQEDENILSITHEQEQPACTVITMYPHLDGVLSLDPTTVLILNQLANSEQYGAVYLVNLFSNIKTPENLKHIKEPYDEHTDIHLMKAISESDTVILAYGAYAKRPIVVKRVEQVMEMLKPHKKKVKKLVNPATNEIMHSLNPKARQKWTLK